MSHFPKELRQAVVFVRDDAIDGALEVREQREPNSSTVWVMRHECLVIGERVVIKEQSWCDVERDKYVDRVMLVSGQDEKYSEHVKQPGGRVEEIEISWCI